MFKLKVIDYFSAAHQLSMINKKCENLHGHNWKVEVCVIGNKLDKAGVLIDFGIIKKILKESLKQLDHKFLNNLTLFKDGEPSSENISIYIAKYFQNKLKGKNITVSEVTSWESEHSCATYYPKGF